MCDPLPAVSHAQRLLETYLPHLRPAQQRGLAEWVAGVLAAQSGCEAAVLNALTDEGRPAHALLGGYPRAGDTGPDLPGFKFRSKSCCTVSMGGVQSHYYL